MRVFGRFAALVAAVWLAISPAAPTHADSVSVSAQVPELALSALQCSPQPYDPTTGLLETSFVASRPCAIVVTFSDSLGVARRVITLAEALAGTSTVTWDARDSAGSIVPSSWYLCTVSASIPGTTMSATLSHTVVVSYGAPLTMKIKGARPRPFSPPGTTDVVVVLSRDAQVSVAIRDSAGKVVLNEPSALWPAGARTFTWDGRDNGGKIVPNGTYTCTFTGVDSGGNMASVSQELTKKKAGK